MSECAECLRLKRMHYEAMWAAEEMATDRDDLVQLCSQFEQDFIGECHRADALAKRVEALVTAGDELEALIVDSAHHIFRHPCQCRDCMALCKKQVVAAWDAAKEST